MPWFWPVWMSVAPGALVAAGLGAGTGGALRLALAAALSPPLIALLFVPLLRTGLDARTAALVVAALSAPGALCLCRSLLHERLRTDPILLYPVGLCLAWLLAHWLTIDGLRLFGWHNLMHLDAIQAVLRGSGVPEEPQLAGTPLGYAWLAYTSPASASVLSREPATTIFPVQNAVLLVATLILVHEAGIRLGIDRAWSACAATLTVLGGHVAREVAGSLGATPPELVATFGDVRLQSMIRKYLYLDLMPISIALLAALLLVAVGLQQQARVRAGLLGAICLAGIALLYPAALPAALSILCGIALCGARSAPGGRRGLAALLGLSALGLAAMGFSVFVTTGPSVTVRAPGAMAPSFLAVAMATAPFALGAALSGWLAFRSGATAMLGLCLAAVVLLCSYPLFQAAALEYKFVMYARLPLALAVGFLFSRLLAGRPGLSLATALVLPLALSVLSLVSSLSHGAPKPLRDAPAVGTDGTHLVLTDPANAWVEALRAAPADTVIVAQGLEWPLGVFADRSLYAPASNDGRLVVGYGLQHGYNLAKLRGHPPLLLRRRAAVARAVFRPASLLEFDNALGELARLKRPIAIVVRPEQDDQTRRYLEANPEWRLLRGEGSHQVWMQRGREETS